MKKREKQSEGKRERGRKGESEAEDSGYMYFIACQNSE